jgi:hypothetical protein
LELEKKTEIGHWAETVSRPVGLAGLSRWHVKRASRVAGWVSWAEVPVGRAGLSSPPGRGTTTAPSSVAQRALCHATVWVGWWCGTVRGREKDLTAGEDGGGGSRSLTGGARLRLRRGEAGVALGAAPVE